MKKLYLTILLAIYLLPSSVFSGPLADEKLLEYLKINGALTEEQVRDIQHILDEERAESAEIAQSRETLKLKDGQKKVDIFYDEGVHFATDNKTFEATIGGVIQADSLVFGKSYPVRNDFDIRRARLFSKGRIYNYFTYKLEAELEGGSSNRLIDAYLNFDYFPQIQLRVGQFKEPFSLEHLISDKYLPFNERSFIYYLTPERDVGVMLHGKLLGETVNYGLGMFNGDGRDAQRRSQKKDKEYTGRIVLRPFYKTNIWFLRGLHLGGGYSYARLDTSDFNFKVRTPARTAFFTVQARAKFNITQQVDSMQRYGLEAAYTLGPLLLMGEFVENSYDGVKLANTDPFDFYVRSWYAGFLLMLTGEKPEMKGGVLKKIRPRRSFDIKQRDWGAFGVAFRYADFEAERIVYEYLVHEGYSVRQAYSITANLNWYLNSMMRITFEYSRTKFSSPLFLGTSWKGYSYYRAVENSFITRFQLEF